ncbi:MAG: hypothetical protein HN686_14425 [Bacteroidetes bacterium]|jgi:hypothetical protein|nr:hypothetical protein [Bacteroidota bacterium]
MASIIIFGKIELFRLSSELWKKEALMAVAFTLIQEILLHGSLRTNLIVFYTSADQH